MAHHTIFSTRVRNQKISKLTGHGVTLPHLVHGHSDISPVAKTSGLMHDSAFLAERGCLGAANLPRPPAPTHQH